MKAARNGPPLTITAWLRFDAIRAALTVIEATRVLEVGSGEGAMGAWLAARYDYTGVEPDEQSRSVAMQRLGTTRVQAEMPSDTEFDLVCAFEVLEHIEDDSGALESWRAVLRRNGSVLVSVPARAKNFGPSDRYVGHFRRYDREDLAKVLDAAGFDVVQWTTYGAGLGQLADAVRNRIVARRPNRSAAVGSAHSGRLFQPKSDARAVMNYGCALPFRVLQRPFARTEIGMGYVVLARARV